MSEGTRPQRIGYRRPSATERLFGRALALAVRVGVVRGHFYVLEVRGRNTGRSMSTPVDVLDLDGRRYLVSPRGETNWARNARAAGEVVLVRAMQRRRYTARELSPEFPGLLDLATFEIGRAWCKAGSPLCPDCYMKQLCPSSH